MAEPFLFKFEHTDQSPFSAYAYQLFLDGDLVGTALAKDACSALALGIDKEDTHGSWQIIPVTQDMAEAGVDIVIPDRDDISITFEEYVGTMEFGWLPVWVFESQNMVTEEEEDEIDE
jgi:hypothetical protein